jgi:hypothetical protein
MEAAILFPTVLNGSSPGYDTTVAADCRTISDIVEQELEMTHRFTPYGQSAM